MSEQHKPPQSSMGSAGSPGSGSQPQPQSQGILESVLHKFTEPAIAKMKTLSDFLLTFLIAANIFAVYYCLRHAIPAAITQINNGHKEARDDFRTMLQEDRNDQAARDERFFQFIQRNGIGGNLNGGNNGNNGGNWNNGARLDGNDINNGFGLTAPLPLSGAFGGMSFGGAGATINGSPNSPTASKGGTGSE